MATQTEHFNFDLREGTDIFNPLSTNPNFESLDTLLWNLQEKVGITEYSNTVNNSQLLLSGTPEVNKTIFKFVAAGDANQFSYAGAGSVANIIGLDGNVFTVNQGSLYVAWVNGDGQMVVVAWPEVVNAQQFDGQPASYYATQTELQAVNTTAGNAVATAQAAATVANNALEQAEAGALKLIWSDYSLTTIEANSTVPFTLTPGKSYMFMLLAYSSGTATRIYSSAIITVPESLTSNTSISISCVARWTSATVYRHYLRSLNYESDNVWTFSTGYIANDDLSGSTDNSKAAVPLAVYQLN